MKKPNVIDAKRWIELHKNAPEYPQVRPDDSPDVIDSEMWLEAAKNSRQSPKVRPNDSTKTVADKSRIELSKKTAHKAIQYILIAVVVGLLIFLGLLVTIETVHPNETFARDILGLSVPDSGILFFFSLHGIIVTIVAALLFYILKLFIHSSKSIE